MLAPTAPGRLEGALLPTTCSSTPCLSPSCLSALSHQHRYSFSRAHASWFLLFSLDSIFSFSLIYHFQVQVSRIWPRLLCHSVFISASDSLSFSLSLSCSQSIFPFSRSSFHSCSSPDDTSTYSFTPWKEEHFATTVMAGFSNPSPTSSSASCRSFEYKQEPWQKMIDIERNLRKARSFPTAQNGR